MRTTILLAWLLLCTGVHAQELDTLVSPKTVTNAQLIGIGGTEILDTYLSPEKYKGNEFTYLSHTIRNYDGKRVSRLLRHQGTFAQTHNRANNANELAGMYTFSYGWLYNWHLLSNNLHVSAGGAIEANLGFVYNTRNSNNPAQARAALQLVPTAAAEYDFHVKKLPFSVRYEVAAPLTGVMFSPNYGQSYYEIFSRDDYDHNAVFTHPGNVPSLRHMLTLDFQLWRQTFRIGYLGNYQQARVNNLKQHQYSHTFVIGWVSRFKTIRLRRAMRR